MDFQSINNTLVVGAGVMGHGIAQVFAQSGLHVDLVDLDESLLKRAMDLAKSNLEVLAEFGRVPEDGIEEILGRIHPSTDLDSAVKDKHFILEAVSEVPEIKKQLFSRLDELCPPDTIIASNTSSLDIFSIASIKRPHRLLVAHWFAPPHIIPLVEVVRGPETALEAVELTANFMKRLGKTPITMEKYIPSFIVNRIQRSISKTVWEMLEMGWATPEQIDLAVKTSLGIRLPIVGVVQSMDFTGLDLIADIMKGRGGVHPLVAEKVKLGHLGAKTSKGIYDYCGRSEEEILKKRDRQYLKILEQLETLKAFDPV
jgi:3-hydroxybutyryl-CoA dehydrogenase